MWSAEPATTYESTVIAFRSISVSRTVTPPGLTSRLCTATSTKSRCSFAGIRVVSAFQKRMSNFRSDVSAEQLAAAVAGLPRADVVRRAGDDVRVDGDRLQVDLGVEDRDTARADQPVVHGHVDEVAVQLRRHPGGVGVPEEDVELPI